jgi:hypothetical protein
MTGNLNVIIDDLASDLGTDTQYFRRDEDKLYLSGIEIALVVATGLVTSYLIGIYRGAKKRVGEIGEKTGAKLVDETVEKLMRLRDRVLGVKADKAKEVFPEVRAIQADLADTIDLSETRALLEQSTDQEIVLIEIRAYLTRIGYPSDIREERAHEFVARLRQDIGSPS